MKPASKVRGRNVQDSYLELVKAFPLRILGDSSQHAQAVEVFSRLTGRRTGLRSGERQYADALAHFIHDYEQREFPLIRSKSSAVERLKYVMEESGTTATDLTRILGVSQPLVSQILSGKRRFTAGHVQRLSEVFKVSAGYFL